MGLHIERHRSDGSTDRYCTLALLAADEPVLIPFYARNWLRSATSAAILNAIIFCL